MQLASCFRVGVLTLALAAAGLAQAASPVAGGYEEERYPAQRGEDLRRLAELSDDERLARLERLQDAGSKYQGQLLQQIQQLQSQLMEMQGALEEAQHKLQQLEPRGAAPAASYSTQGGYVPATQGGYVPAQPAYGQAAPGQAAPPQPGYAQPQPAQTAPARAVDPALESGAGSALDAGQPLTTVGEQPAAGMGPGFGGSLSTGAPSPAGTAPAQVQLPAAQPGAAAPAAVLQPAGANELADLDKAFQLVRNKQYDAAAGAYKQFIASYPASESTPTAHYWLGQVYFAKRDYDAAQKEFQTVLERYAGHAKTDEAMLKLAYIHQSKGNNAKAIAVYKDIMARFPGKPSAQLAGKRLEALKKSS